MTDKTTDRLFELRLAWIKSISRIWAAMEKYPNRYLLEDEFCSKLIKKNYNEYKTKDGSQLKFGAMDVFGEYKLFDNPWNIELHIKESAEAPSWNPHAGSYEVADPEKIEQVLLYVPNAPEKNRTQALADYYSCAPSIFGGFESPNPGDPAPTASIGSGSGSKDGSKFDVGDDTGSLYEFGAVLADAVSLSWINETFKNALVTQDPIDSIGNIRVEEQGKARKVLHENFGYKFPWNFDLIIGIDEDAKYVETNDRAGTGYRWCTSKNSRLVLVRPEPPKSLNEYGPVALAAYNAGGTKYPFTCG